MTLNNYHIDDVSGVYLLHSALFPHKGYVGCSLHIPQRIDAHKSLLINHQHTSRELQDHVNKYGLSDINIDIVELCNPDILHEREQLYIDILKPVFNTSKIGRTSITRILNKAI